MCSVEASSSTDFRKCTDYGNQFALGVLPGHVRQLSPQWRGESPLERRCVRHHYSPAELPEKCGAPPHLLPRLFEDRGGYHRGGGGIASKTCPSSSAEDSFFPDASAFCIVRFAYEWPFP